ncbi:MAG: FAD-binding oxidoreductase [Anaerolineales bacterium]|nr:FAD-binding oxidoreductase [Anaerolineales bacterium]
MKPSIYNTLTRLENYGHSHHAPSFLFQPQNVAEIEKAFETARKQGLTITLRGAGKSYNDAALNGGGIVLDLQGMNRILEWDPASGLIKVEPGVTIHQLWQHVLPDGWWPPVVSGTMTTTLGGCLGMNIHGKNNFRMGTIGEHVIEFTVLLPTGLEIVCGPKKNGDLFRAMIGGLGMLGVFTTITLQMKRTHSGLLTVRAWNVPHLRSHLDEIETGASEHDYFVGWLDATARGRGLGRGQLHAADYLHEGDDPAAARTLQIDYQTLPSTFFGLMPKSLLHYFMAPFMNNLGTWGVNTAKYYMGSRAKTYRQAHAAFHFLLDYIPDWELAYGRSGLIQYQSFLPRATALEAWTEMLALSQRRGLPSYLGVTKRHRPDKFLLTHAVDGFSLALDFKVTGRNRTRLAGLLQDFDRIVVDAGGRFYFAKNSETTAATARLFLGQDVVTRFKALKRRCDPKNLLESDLYRRVFGE